MTHAVGVRDTLSTFYGVKMPSTTTKKKYTREQAHDKLYAIAVRILKSMDACSKCPIFKKDTVPGSCGFSKAWCCEGCPYLDPAKGGCQVEALTCRIALCSAESGRQMQINPRLRSRMRRVALIARSYNLLLARASKEDALKYGETKPIWWLYRKNNGHYQPTGII